MYSEGNAEFADITRFGFFSTTVTYKNGHIVYLLWGYILTYCFKSVLSVILVRIISTFKLRLFHKGCKCYYIWIAPFKDF